MTITKFYHRRVFTMKKAQIIVDKYFLTGKQTKGSSAPLLNILDVRFMRAFIRKAVLFLTSRDSVRILWNW